MYPPSGEAGGREAPSEGNAVLSTGDQCAEGLGRCGALKFVTFHDKQLRGQARKAGAKWEWY